MTMRDRGSDETDEMIVLDLNQEVYLKGKEEPVRVNSTFQIRKELIDKDTPVEDFMSVAMQHLLSTVDVVREHRYLLSDGENNKFVFLVDEIQAVSLLAPSKETVLKAMEA